MISSSKNMTKIMTEKNSPTNSDLNMRRLDKDEIIRLERQ